MFSINFAREKNALTVERVVSRARARGAPWRLARAPRARAGGGTRGRAGGVVHKKKLILGIPIRIKISTRNIQRE